MKLTISKNANPNYLAKIVNITTFSAHPNADKLKLANVDGYMTAVGINAKPGMFVYFPVECCISQKYLHENNLYRITTMNRDFEAIPGFFEGNGRVRCIKLRGFTSEGLIMPFETLLPSNASASTFVDLIGTEFDTIDNELLVKKYVTPRKSEGHPNHQGKKEKVYEELIVAGQFRFHSDTEQLKKHLYKFQTDTQIHISHKFHGTSAIFCNLLVKKDLSIWQRFLNLIGGNIVKTEYHAFCSSRKVVKDPGLNKGLTQGYYTYDIWNLALNVIKPYLQKGMTIYAEIVGYMPNGSMIQKDYDYGCIYDSTVDYSKMTPQQMYDEKLFKIYVYRITYTNVEGRVFEMSAHNLNQYCRSKGLSPVIEDFYGTVFDFVENHCTNHYHEGVTQGSYEEHFLNCLIDKYLERGCGWCRNKVPAEGVVVRIDQPEFEAYKLKSLAFLQHESKMLDEGAVDIESEQSEGN